MSNGHQRVPWAGFKAALSMLAVSALAFALASPSFGDHDHDDDDDRSPPTISGDPIVGETLTSSSAGNSGLYVWQRCDPAVTSCEPGPRWDPDWEDIEGAHGHDAQSYTLTSDDLGKFIRVKAKRTSWGGKFVPSLPVGPVEDATPPPPPPEITGEPVVGSTLSANDAGPEALYRWQRCNPTTSACGEDDPGWTDIPGADEQTYTLTEADQGHLVRVLVNGDPSGSTFVPSEPVGPIAPAPAAQSTGPAPQHGIQFLAQPVSGPVLVKIPGASGFVPLTELTEIPFGSIFDIRGRSNCVELIAATGVLGNETPDKSIELCGTPFKTSQSPELDSDAVARILKPKCGNGNGSSAKSSASSGPVASAAARRRRGRLWASGGGGYATQGAGGTGSVRGTTWLTKETCAGTFFKVSNEPGVHGIDVLAKGENDPIFLGPGDSYFAER